MFCTGSPKQIISPDLRPMTNTLTTLMLILSTHLCLGQSSLHNTVAYFQKEKNFNGTVLVASGGKIDYLAGVGIANRQNITDILPQTKFKIASITKTFTAVLILRLFEQGKIDLNATIGQYLPEYKGPGRDKVTIHHLLTYSSGIANCEGNTGILVYQSPISTDDFIAEYCSGSLAFEPGTQFSYNNGDYIILGKIIEKITGNTFEEQLKREILEPLEMENTDMLYSKEIIPGLADTYNIDDSTGVYYKDDPMYIENYYAAGSMYSTAEDLFKFDQAIFNHNLLNKKTTDLMLTPYPALYGVAYGFWVTENTFGAESIKVANRQGSIWGANADWLHLIDKNITILVLSNTNATNLPELTEQLVLLSTGQNTTLPVTKEKTK
jgi:CubicO group peptidase (beta-lactamase class C family)